MDSANIADDRMPAVSSSHSPPPPLIAAEHAKDGKYHLLLAASGSVATIKIPDIIHGLACYPAISIRLVLTKSSAEFLQGQSNEQPSLAAIAALPNVDGVYLDADEWRTPWTRGAPILHIELRRWADLLVIAPLSANTLAKIANGICDNLLTSVVRAWEVNHDAMEPQPPDTLRLDVNWRPRDVQKYIIVAPAMNTMMWKHPLTVQHLKRFPEALQVSEAIKDQDPPYHWFKVLRPEEMTLACGDVGVGGMRSWKEIVRAVERRISEQGVLPRTS